MPHASDERASRPLILDGEVIGTTDFEPSVTPKPGWAEWLHGRRRGNGAMSDPPQIRLFPIFAGGTLVSWQVAAGAEHLPWCNVVKLESSWDQRLRALSQG